VEHLDFPPREVDSRTAIALACASPAKARRLPWCGFYMMQLKHKTDGRLAVVTFHSLEDRIVKNKFRAPQVPGRVLTKKVVTGTDEELRRNPRARSAKLRAWEKI